MAIAGLFGHIGDAAAADVASTGKAAAKSAAGHDAEATAGRAVAKSKSDTIDTTASKNAGLMPEPMGQWIVNNVRRQLTQVGNLLKFDRLRARMKAAFRPSEKQLRTKVNTFDQSLPKKTLDLKNQAREAAFDVGKSVTSSPNLMRNVLSHQGDIKDAVSSKPGLEVKTGKNGGETLIDPKTGETAGMTDGAIHGLFAGLTKKNAENMGMSEERYTNPGLASSLHAVGTAAGPTTKIIRFSVKQNQLEREAKAADKAAQQLADLRLGEKAGEPAVSRAEKTDVFSPSEISDTFSNKRLLTPEDKDWSLSSGHDQQAVSDQLAQRAQRAANLERQFPEQHNATLQAWVNRNDVQRTLGFQIIPAVAKGTIGTGLDKLAGTETHLGFNIGKEVGQSLGDTKVVYDMLNTQQKLDAEAATFANTRNDLRGIRKQEAFENMTQATVSDEGDIFYDTAETPEEIDARELQAQTKGDKALPDHTALNPERLPVEHFDMIPSGIYDGARRLFTNQGTVEQLSIPLEYTA